MGKYDDSIKAIYSVFDMAGWKALSIPTYPSNFVAAVPGNKYIRVTPIFGSEAIDIRSSSGILNIDIFTPAGEGTANAIAIADHLDAYLVAKLLSGTNGKVQFGNSYLASQGADKSNNSLYRHLYTIPFNYFGV